MARINRRDLLATTAFFVLTGPPALHAAIVRDGLPWAPGATAAPTPVVPGPWRYFTPDEGAAVEALVDRLIPPDPATPGGKDCGCAVFIDRQLAGPYGGFEGHYMSGPFHDGTKEQGPQSPVTPAQHYRQALAALDRHCRASFGGKRFAELADQQKDQVIQGLEDGSVTLEGTSAQEFFKLLLTDTQTGFFADPIYGGNKDMASWKMIGFPGARYDYRDWVDRHNERVTLPPIGIADHPDWAASR
jgi:gluconate 2-dehydrogenase gamma chain